MLQSLPDVLDDLERRLVEGEDPMPLLGAVRWPELEGWPSNREEATTLKLRLSSLMALIHGLQAPLQASLVPLTTHGGYGAKGAMPLPRSLSLRFSDHI
ncbi:MAG: hypothetical protein LWX11_03245 [Firmicutes bacterium]|nr:hypothetical protein [Bacillota bacterium]